MSNKKFKEAMKARPQPHCKKEHDSSSVVLKGEDPLDFIYDQGPGYIFLTVNTREYPESLESLESKFPGIDSKVKADNEELDSLVNHAVKNNLEHQLFYQVARNFSNNEDASLRIYSEMQENYINYLSNKIEGVYERNTISKDCTKKSIIDSIRNHGSKNYSYDHGIFLEKNPLAVQERKTK